jgi:hypothetical protein
MAYRPSSARRQQTSVNPITGERIDYGKKVNFIKDQTIPMYAYFIQFLFDYKVYHFI